jgi:hypothetical protein
MNEIKCEICNERKVTEYCRCYPKLITKQQEARGVCGIDCYDRLLRVCTECNKQDRLRFYDPETKEG